VLRLDHDSGNGEASLAVDACLVRFTIDSCCRVVTKAPVGGIGVSTCDQIVQHFLLHLGPNRVGKQENALCLGFGMEELSAAPASDAAA